MKRNSQKQITRAYHSRIKSMLKGQVEREIFDALAAGKNTYLRYDRLQSSSFDSSWIEMIEGVIFDLGEIISNPRMTTKVEGNIVPVELARKTGAESVQHLSSHTQYIKEIDEYGNVIPSKIMTMVSEDDLHTYENRFIATLVRRLVLFIEKRYEVVSEFAELKNQEVLMFKNKSIVNGAEVEIETKVKIAYKSDDKEALKSSAYIERIKQIRTYILYFYNSAFMRQLKTERDVRNPILQTNIIRKNPKYHHCYEVYRFIETYDRLGVNYKVDENYSLFNEEEMNELNHTLFANYVTLRGKDISKNHKEIKHIYKPRIATSIDDEQFIYGHLLKGPITFVRADEKYQEYLNSKIRKDLPLHPTKHEKEYYADEYEEKRQIKEDAKQREDLLKRKNKELRQFEKQVEKILKEREEARQRLLQQEKDIIAKEENDLLTKARNELIAASLEHQEQAEQDFKNKQEEHQLNELRERIANTKVVEPSHPHTDPVTYEEAVEEIWPNTKSAPTLRVPSQEDNEVYSVESEYPDEPIIQEGMSFDDAAKEIWPELSKPIPGPAKSKPVVAEPLDEEIMPAVVPVAMSHPMSEPVTYEQAVEQIWPQVVNAPALRVEKKKRTSRKVKPIPQPVEEVVEETPVVESYDDIEPAIVPVAMSHPISKPVTYEEAVEEIWPNINKPVPVVKKEEQPGRRIKKQFKTTDGSIVTIYEKSGVNDKAVENKKFEPKPVIKASKKEKPVQEDEIKPAVVPVPMSHPASEPVTYDQAVEQIWPQTLNAPAQRVEKKEPAPIKKAPSKKKPAPKKAEVDKKPVTRVKKPEPVVEEPKEAPVIEEAKPVETPVTEAPKAKKTPAKKKAPAKKKEPQAKPIEKPVETPKEEPKPAPRKESKPKVSKPVPVIKKPEPKAPVKKQAPMKEPVNKPIREKIPGKFIVKTNKGYYIDRNKYSIYKDQAKVFDDFNLAKDIKDAQGGKIVKL